MSLLRVSSFLFSLSSVPNYISFLALPITNAPTANMLEVCNGSVSNSVANGFRTRSPHNLKPQQPLNLGLQPARFRSSWLTGVFIANSGLTFD